MAQEGATQEVPVMAYALSHETLTAKEVVKAGEAAERAGFDLVGVSDHFQPWQDNQGHATMPWVTLGAMGQRTERVAMGTGVTCPTYRYNPSIVAQAFATLDVLYPGRVFLGLGTGEKFNEAAAGGGWGPYAERAGRLGEAIGVIRRLWSGEWVEHEGRYYRVNGKLYDPPQNPVPIYVAAAGPKSARLAGELGDGMWTDPGAMQKPGFMEAFREGAQSAGKDPAAMPVLANMMAWVGDDASEATRHAPPFNFMLKAWEPGYFDNDTPMGVQLNAEKEIALSDVVGSWVVSTDPGEHVRAIQGLVDMGVSHVFVMSAQPDQEAVAGFYGGEVLPRVRSGEVTGARRVASP